MERHSTIARYDPAPPSPLHGLVHALLGIGDREGLLAHPVVGGSWEGLAIESLIAAAPAGSEA